MIRIFYYILSFFIVLSVLACGTLDRFKSGNEAYQRKHYSTAISLFQEELSHVNNKETAARKMFLIAESFRNMDLPRNSIKWYKKSIKNGAGVEVYFNFVKVLKKMEKYSEALNILLKAEKKFGRSSLLNRDISICKQAARWKEKMNKHIEVNLLDINSEFSDFASDFYFDDYFVFSSDRFNSSREVYPWTGNFYFDLYISDVNGLTEVEPLSNDINSKYNEASACFNSDGSEMYFVRCGDEKVDIRNCKIYRSIKMGNEWTQVSVMSFVKENINYISPWLSEDGNILYFSSDDPNGFGGYDIYFVVREADGWSSPTILPKPINTIGNEKFITTWKNELYFSSDFLAGMGGYDIFQSNIDSNDKLSPPKHLDYPLNSGGDDFYFLKNSDTTGLLSSSRIEGKGLDDIYAFVIRTNRDSIANDSLSKEIDEKSVEKKIYLAVKVVENIYSEEGNPNSRILGKKPVGKAVVSLLGSTNDRFETASNGTVVKEVDFDKIYNVIAGKKGYLTNSQHVKVKSESGYDEEIVTINITILLDRIYFGKEVVLKNIYYDYDSWKLRDKSIPTLDELYLILKNNTKYKIKIGSHTDCRGEENYNQVLSLKRAASVVEYLVSKGISKDRLESVGYGESRLIETCDCNSCSEQQHQRNRRTTFEILK